MLNILTYLWDTFHPARFWGGWKWSTSRRSAKRYFIEVNWYIRFLFYWRLIYFHRNLIFFLGINSNWFFLNQSEQFRRTYVTCKIFETIHVILINHNLLIDSALFLTVFFWLWNIVALVQNYLTNTGFVYPQVTIFTIYNFTAHFKYTFNFKSFATYIYNKSTKFPKYLHTSRQFLNYLSICSVQGILRELRVVSCPWAVLLLRHLLRGTMNSPTTIQKVSDHTYIKMLLTENFQYE